MHLARFAALAALLAWVAVSADFASAQGANKNVNGKLKSVDEKAAFIVMETKDGDLKVPYNLSQTVVPGKPFPTTLLLQAPGSPKLLTAGSAVHFSNVKFDLADFYKLADARIILMPFGKLPENRLNFDGAAESFFSAMVVNTNPLQVRIVGKDVPATVEIAKDKQKPVKFAVRDKLFDVGIKEIKVRLGNRLSLAGAGATVHAIIYTKDGNAQQLQITRKEEVTPDDLKAWLKMK